MFIFLLFWTLLEEVRLRAPRLLKAKEGLQANSLLESMHQVVVCFFSSVGVPPRHRGKEAARAAFEFKHAGKLLDSKLVLLLSLFLHIVVRELPIYFVVGNSPVGVTA